MSNQTRYEVLAADPRFRPNVDDDDYYMFLAEFGVDAFADYPAFEYKFSEYVNLENYFNLENPITGWGSKQSGSCRVGLKLFTVVSGRVEFPTNEEHYSEVTLKIG